MIAQRHSLLLLLFALLLLGCHQAEAQRIRATGGVTFYAGPNGTDDGNNCLSPANPCTLHGAHSVAQRDWDLPGCVIRLADGIYTRGVSIAGQYVGTHFCQVFGHVDQDGVCLDRTAVVINDPRAAFAIEDGMMTSIACLTVMGGSDSTDGSMSLSILPTWLAIKYRSASR